MADEDVDPARDGEQDKAVRELRERLREAEKVNKVLLKDRLGEENTRGERREAGEGLRRAFKDGKGRFIPVRFADWLTGSFPLTKFVTPFNDQGGDVIWMYHEDLGIYVEDGVPWTEQQLKNIMGEDTSTGYYGDVVKHLQVSTYTDPGAFTEEPTIIVLRNGALNVVTGELLPHSPLYNAKTRIPITYREDADCPVIKAFLGRVAPENMGFLQEWVGYHLLKDYRYQRCVVLVGEGDNGKSTFLSLLTTFLGPGNVTSQSLYRLSSNRFAPAELQGKLANIAADIGPDELRHTGTLKMLTGGDWITAERKNRDPFKFLNYAKLSFSCNQLPRTPDETLAFFKRFIVIMFNETIPKEEQDPGLLEKMTIDEELSGFLNWALEGLKRLMKQSGFSEAGTAMERKELYKRMSDPVTGFVNECVEEDPEAWVEKQAVLRAFAEYCRARGFIPTSDRKFIEEFRKQVTCRETQIRVGNTRPRIFKGLKLTENALGVTDVTEVTSSTTYPLEKFSPGPVSEACDSWDTSDRQKRRQHNVPESASEPAQSVTDDRGSQPHQPEPGRASKLKPVLLDLVRGLTYLEGEAGDAVKAEDLKAHMNRYYRWDLRASVYFDNILSLALKEGVVYSPRPGYYRVTRP